MSYKLQNDRFNVDEEHLHRELVSAGIHEMSSIPSISMGEEILCKLYCWTCKKHFTITEKEYYRLEKQYYERNG